MNIKIKSIADNGKQTEERLLLNVIDDDNMKNYLVLDSTYNADGTLSNKERHPFWFPEKPVKKGDLVVLYTKKGTYSQTKYKDGSTSHFFYWDVKNCVWNNEQDRAVLIKIQDWESKQNNNKAK